MLLLSSHNPIFMPIKLFWKLQFFCKSNPPYCSCSKWAVHCLGCSSWRKHLEIINNQLATYVVHWTRFVDFQIFSSDCSNMPFPFVPHWLMYAAKRERRKLRDPDNLHLGKSRRLGLNEKECRELIRRGQFSGSSNGFCGRALSHILKNPEYIFTTLFFGRTSSRNVEI